MPDYKLWGVLTPVMAWKYTLTLTPESRAALLDPHIPLARRASVVWLLLAPIITAILWIYLPGAVSTFTFVTSLICNYYTRSVEKLCPSKKNKEEEFRAFCAGLDDLKHDELMLKSMDLTERSINILPPNSLYSERETVLLHLKKAREAYSRMLQQMQVARFGSSNDGGDGAKSSAISDNKPTIPDPTRAE
ncbi:hypothetical protein PG993_013436 [Apiospora rasikravindrae]|uniref:Uncharacterized protein n=1 Tax=Apiospora rasikravindrae TaxID=990691 RepID=A0ABR1RZS1_9PEZI